MPLETRMPSAAENRYDMLLAVSEAANAQLDFVGVLEAVARVLRPIVALDGISVTTVEEDLLRAHAAHVVGFERRGGESFLEATARGLGVSRESLPTVVPLAGSAGEFVARTGRAYLSRDLEAERRFPEDDLLHPLGVRCYACVPLFIRERPLGYLLVSRLQPRPFTSEDGAILEAVSRPIAMAVANSLAYEEIRHLKEQFQAENVVLREEIDQQSMFEEIVGSSLALQAVLARVEKVAATDSTVLITGETGTGKELVARAIHRRSTRSSRALIKVTCAALPEALIASELFGHEKGAFTGALTRRVGRFELASGGSIFLDEIGELPAETQVSLLRVLQEGEFERVGGTQTIRTDARVIAATNRDLAAAVASGRFRQDLFYRLNVFPIEMPPLRARKGDIPVLVEYVASRYAARLGKRIERIDRHTMGRLVAYRWPGNVRELQNIVERAAILSEGGVLHVEDSDLCGVPAEPSETSTSPSSEPATLRDHEKRLIESVLLETRGRISGPKGAAVRLGIPPTTLESKMKRYAIDARRFRS
jgi:formate hydrogenlyase transcriptional activator